MPIKTPQAVQTCHEFLRWLIPHLDKFPRNRRFTLGERLEDGLLEVLELLLEAAYSKDKRPPLTAANRRLARCRHLWRLAYELKTISLAAYEYGARQMYSIGSQIGGWIKSEEEALRQ